MKYIKKLLLIIMLILMAVILRISIKEDITPGNAFAGNTEIPAGTWSAENKKGELYLEYRYKIPDKTTEEWVLQLQSHWPAYEISVDGNIIYRADSDRKGAIHLFRIPYGKELSVHFINADEHSKNAIMQSKLYLGDSELVYSSIIRKNLYAVIFMILSVIVGVISLCVGIYMKKVWTKDTCKSLRSLGIYIICAGSWILTDSRIFLLLTQKTGMIEQISFLCFFFMPVPLLEFTKKIMPQKERMLFILQDLFLLMEGIYVVNYIGQFVPVTIMIVAEHLLMAVTIILILYGGFIELRQRKDKKLIRVLVGYIIFSVFSVLAFVFFYKNHSYGYSLCYVTGILGFIFCLGDAACIGVYEQMEDNANAALYAKMAYLDMMTGLGNRAAFLLEKEEQESYAGPAAYIMIDANNLKKINDGQGHQKGDELLLEIAGAIKHVAAGTEKCYRIGGDEFVVSLFGKTCAEVKECVDALQREIDRADRQCDIEISAAIGYAWTDDREKNLDALLDAADKAMYENKEKMKQKR